MSACRTIFLIVCLLLLLPGCQRDTEEAKVRKVIMAIERAAEEKDIRTILSHLSKTYHDSRGYDFNGVKGLLLSYFFRNQRISVYLTNLDVTADSVSARATFQAVLSAADKTGSAVGVIPDALGIYAFEVVFSKESEEWMVVTSTWERLGDAPLGKAQ